MSCMKHTFLPKNFVLESWESVRPYFEKLETHEFDTEEDLRQWLRAKSELESFLSENLGWRYIRMTCDTANEDYAKAFEYYISEIEPQVNKHAHMLNKKLWETSLKEKLQLPEEMLLLQCIENQIRNFNEKNLELNTQVQQKQTEYGSIVGALMVLHEDKHLTLQQASALLQSTDENFRKTIYIKIQEQRLSAKDKLNALFEELMKLRQQIATNAGHASFTDYMFVELCRFDYTKDDCKKIHESVEKSVVPMLEVLYTKKAARMGKTKLKPYDMSVDPEMRQALKPFENEEELVEKTKTCFEKIDPFFGYCIEQLKAANRLDLSSRKGKAPGGYNYPLYESGLPFIFMNSAGTLRDLVTMVHEGGHAVHSILTHDLELTAYKNIPSEVAELASMGMELISMEHWDVFFADKKELARAKKEHLEQILETLPWVALIDAFQHWIYQNPQHTTTERESKWLELHQRFSPRSIDWEEYVHVRSNLWQKQLHLFEVPFYYIEYAMAQLGAVALWKQYKVSPEESIQKYKKALSLGYTRSISEIYAEAGIKFDFSNEYISDLMLFVQKEIEHMDGLASES